MKKLLLSLNFTLVAVGCGAATSTETQSSDLVAANPSANISARTADVVPTTAKNVFSIPANARKLVGGQDSILRRTSGYHFQTDQVSKPTFVKPSTDTTGKQLKGAAQRFFATFGNTRLAQQLQSAALDSTGPLWQLSTGDASAVAYSVPQSGSIGLYRKPNWREPTPIKDASEAVSTALGAIADNELLNLADGETLDVVGIHARHMGTTDASSATSIKVGYMVIFGRLFAGVPVHGPTTTVGLDASGKMSTFQRNWREIAGVSGTLTVASDSTIASRRDRVAAHFLTDMQVNCGYVEDVHPKAIQDGPGLGCGFQLVDPNSADRLSQSSEEWVNAAEDESTPLQGTLPE